MFMDDAPGVLFPRLELLEVKSPRLKGSADEDVLEMFRLLAGPSLARIFIDMPGSNSSPVLRREILPSLSHSQNVQVLHLKHWYAFQPGGDDTDIGLFPNLEEFKTDCAISRMAWIALEHHPRLRSISISSWPMDLPWSTPYSIILHHLRSLDMANTVPARVVASLLLHTTMPSLTTISFNLHESCTALDGLSLDDMGAIILALKKRSPLIEHFDVRLHGSEPFWVLAGLSELNGIMTISIRSAHVAFQLSPADPQLVAERSPKLRKIIVNEKTVNVREEILMLNSVEMVATGGSTDCAAGGSTDHELSIPELRLQIFENLTAEDLLHASLVCKSWSEPALNSKWRVRTVRLSHWVNGLLDRLNRPSQRWRQLVGSFPPLSLTSF